MGNTASVKRGQRTAGAPPTARSGELAPMKRTNIVFRGIENAIRQRWFRTKTTAAGTNDGAPKRTEPTQASHATVDRDQAGPEPVQTESIHLFSRESSKRSKSTRNLFASDTEAPVDANHNEEKEDQPANIHPDSALHVANESSLNLASVEIDGQSTAEGLHGEAPTLSSGTDESITIEQKVEATDIAKEGVSHQDKIATNNNDIAQSVSAEQSVEEVKFGSPQDIEMKCKALNDALESGDVNLMHEAVLSIRTLLSQPKNPPIQAVIDGGGAESLLTILRSYRDVLEALTFETLWAVTNITSGTHKQTEFIIERGGLELVHQILLETTSQDCNEQSTWCLGNIAGDSPLFRDLVLSLGIVNEVANRLMTFGSRTSVRRNISFLAANLCRGKPVPPLFTILPLVNAAASCLMREKEDYDVVVDCLWILSYASDGELERINAIIETGVVPRIWTLIINPLVFERSYLAPILRTAGNIASGDDQCVDYLLQSNALAVFAKVLDGWPTTAIKKDACWGLSNIAAGTIPQRRSLLDHEFIIGRVLAIVETAETCIVDVFREACWVIRNLVDSAVLNWSTLRINRYPFLQSLIFSFRYHPDLGVIRRGIFEIAQLPFSKLIHEIRNVPHEGFRHGIVNNENPFETISQVSNISQANLLWVLLAMGCRTTNINGDHKLLDLEMDDLAHERALAFHAIVILLAQCLKGPQTGAHVWLPIDIWRRFWTFLIEIY